MTLHNGAQMNGAAIPSPAEEEELYTQLLRLEDAVIHGKHPSIKLPPASIEALKASLSALAVVPVSNRPAVNGHLNDAAFNANATTNHLQQNGTPVAPSMSSIPGLQARPASLKPTSSSGLDPIFLEKSDSLVRAEGQLKRQRIERDLQVQVEQRKNVRDKDAGADGPAVIDIDAILVGSRMREPLVSGLIRKRAESVASSFDENDYYSSQVQSDWSSPASASKGSDRAAGAFTADFESIEASSAAFPSHKKAGKQPVRDPEPTSGAEMGETFDVDDDDDEYAPPDASAFNNVYGSKPAMAVPVLATNDDDDDDDDDDEYEPGEITQQSDVLTPYHAMHQPAQTSPQVPLIRNNHLTHIAAPQPNRVSPLAVAKRPSIELELVNGRPEIAQTARHHTRAPHSRTSTASPVGNGSNRREKKNQRKKRKRDLEPSGRGKRKRERQNAAPSPPPGQQFGEPRIKDEPISPPPFANVPEAPHYPQRASQYKSMEIDLVSPRSGQPQVVYAPEPPQSALRYEYQQPTSPAVVRVASPASYRPTQRDTQDLRRVASLHYAQRPPSPQRVYSPVPYRTASVSYGEPRVSGALPESDRYQTQPMAEDVRYVRARSRSPQRPQEYRDLYARAQSPAVIAPPPIPSRKIVVDQHGNRYYAIEPTAAPPASMRASVAPVERPAPVEYQYERAPSRMATAPYGQPPSSAAQYELADTRMGPPPSRRQISDDQPIQYVDANGYRVRDYSTRPVEAVRYVEASTSPVYQAPPRYDMPPPPAPSSAREPTSPVYTPTRSYSVRPEEPARPVHAYAARQASVAPIQYVRQDAPPASASVRAMSVVPGYEAPQAYSQASQQVRYVDQYGREVYPSNVRQVSVAAPEYRY